MVILDASVLNLVARTCLRVGIVDNVCACGSAARIFNVNTVYSTSLLVFEPEVTYQHSEQILVCLVG